MQEGYPGLEGVKILIIYVFSHTYLSVVYKLTVMCYDTISVMLGGLMLFYWQYYLLHVEGIILLQFELEIGLCGP